MRRAFRVSFPAAPAQRKSVWSGTASRGPREFSCGFPAFIFLIIPAPRRRPTAAMSRRGRACAGAPHVTRCGGGTLREASDRGIANIISPERRACTPPSAESPDRS